MYVAVAAARVNGDLNAEKYPPMDDSCKGCYSNPNLHWLSRRAARQYGCRHTGCRRNIHSALTQTCADIFQSFWALNCTLSSCLLGECTVMKLPLSQPPLKIRTSSAFAFRCTSAACMKRMSLSFGTCAHMACRHSKVHRSAHKALFEAVFDACLCPAVCPGCTIACTTH